MGAVPVFTVMVLAPPVRLPIQAVAVPRWCEELKQLEVPGLRFQVPPPDMELIVTEEVLPYTTTITPAFPLPTAETLRLQLALELPQLNPEFFD